VSVRCVRIEWVDVEAACCRHDRVREAVVVPRDDPDEERSLAAYVVPRGETVPTGAALAAYLREKLPAYMIPSRFVLAEEIPRLPNGKVDRAALPPQARDGSRPDGITVPRAPLESLLPS